MRFAAGALYSFLNRLSVREMDDHDPMIALYARADRVGNAPVIHVAMLPANWKARQSAGSPQAEPPLDGQKGRLHDPT